MTKRVLHDRGAPPIIPMQFDDEERTRTHELAVKNPARTLSPEQELELDWVGSIPDV